MNSFSWLAVETQTAFTSSKPTIETPEQCEQRSDVFIANIKQISQIVLVFVLLTLD